MRFPFPTSPAEAGPGTLITFLGAVPGVGASTLACISALGVAEKNTDVALVDLNPQGKVRSYMGLTPDVCPASILDVAGVARPEEIRRAGVDHPKGVFVIPGPVRPLDAPQVDTSLVLKTLTFLKKVFPVSVAVSGPLYGSGWAAVLVSDLVCLVMSPDRPSVDAYRETVDLLARLGVGERLKVVLNAAGGPGALRTADVVSAVKPDAVVNYDAGVRASANKRLIVSPSAASILSDIYRGVGIKC